MSGFRFSITSFDNLVVVSITGFDRFSMLAMLSFIKSALAANVNKCQHVRRCCSLFNMRFCEVLNSAFEVRNVEIF